MFRYSENYRKKQALVAVLILLLCFVSLVGSTYALFTSNLNDGTIGVITTAGNIKVDIVDAVDGKQSLVGEVLQFQTTASNREILFEPGSTFFTQPFKVKNTGNIPIKFRLAISDDESIGTEEFNEAFEIWISLTPTKPTDAKRITAFTGELEVGQSSGPYYLFVKMKETAGNKFQGKEYTGIGVTVYAVQGNAVIKE